MGLFKWGKKDDVVDLTEHYKKQQEKEAEKQESDSQTSTSGGAFSFLGNLENSGSSSTTSSIPSTTTTSSGSDEGYVDVAGTVSEKRKRLIKRIMDMTSKMEDLSNQIYHLQQRIEVLERKSGVS